MLTIEVNVIDSLNSVSLINSKQVKRDSKTPVNIKRNEKKKTNETNISNAYMRQITKSVLISYITHNNMPSKQIIEEMRPLNSFLFSLTSY